MYDFGDIEKQADYTQFDFDVLSKVADELFPYLQECFEVVDSKTLLEPFNHGQFHSSHRDNYTGVKHETSLEEMIEMMTKSKLNTGEKEYLKGRYE